MFCNVRFVQLVGVAEHLTVVLSARLASFPFQFFKHGLVVDVRKGPHKEGHHNSRCEIVKYLHTKTAVPRLAFQPPSEIGG